MPDEPFDAPERDLADMAGDLEARAATAFGTGQLQYAATLAQAAALYRCAHVLAHIQDVLERWPTPDA